jgi:acetyl-CoA C-acetyltransferase
MAGIVMKEAAKRANLNPEEIDDVLFGCANQAGEDNRNVARMGSLLAGFPDRVPAVTVNRLCGSSLDTVIQAARAIKAGEADIIVTGGVESMSRAPYSLPKNVSGAALFGNLTAYDTALGWRYPNPRLEAMFPLESMGETAENVAEQWKISREDQDAFAYESHQRAIAAQERGDYTAELVPITIEGKKEVVIVDTDEQPRKDTSLEKMAALRPAFRKGGTVTAGNSSSLNDGASAVVVVSEAALKRLGVEPMARYVSGASEGLSPRIMGVGPIYATQKALAKANLQIKDMDLIELNEAFASQSLAVIRELGLDKERVNPNGGAIAIGHPLGASGGRLVATLLYQMKARNMRRGLATMCIGVGQGIAAVFERP